jgi:hypothetical protein
MSENEPQGDSPAEDALSNDEQVPDMYEGTLFRAAMEAAHHRYPSSEPALSRPLSEAAIEAASPDYKPAGTPDGQPPTASRSTWELGKEAGRRITGLAGESHEEERPQTINFMDFYQFFGDYPKVKIFSEWDRLVAMVRDLSRRTGEGLVENSRTPLYEVRPDLVKIPDYLKRLERNPKSKKAKDLVKRHIDNHMQFMKKYAKTCIHFADLDKMLTDHPEYFEEYTRGVTYELLGEFIDSLRKLTPDENVA